MKKLLITSLVFGSFSSFACRPNIYAIKNKLVLKSLDAVSERNDLEKISTVKVSNIQMAYVVRPSNGINCPDQYSASVTVKLADKCFVVNATLSAKPENNTAEAIEIECE